MKRNLKVGTYFGIDVFLHYSWFIIFILLAWGLATGWFPQQFEGRQVYEYWTLGLLSSLLLFFSVLLHEMAHSLVAIKHGMKVEKITLFFFGGMAGMNENKMSPKIEFQTAIAGPILSLMLGMLFFGVYWVSNWFYVSAVSSYLYRINFILAIFNMVPGFPLDGGRVLRSIIWYWTKDFKKATKIASTGGKLLAYVLIFMGFVNIFSGNFGGLWLVMIGLFVLALSTMSYEQVMIKDALTGRTVADFTVKKFPSLKPDMSIREAVTQHFLKQDADIFPVIKKGILQGVLTVEPIRVLDKKQWRGKKVSDLMVKFGKTPKVSLTASAYTALIKMMKAKVGSVPVITGKTIVGIVRTRDVLRYVKLKNAEERFKNSEFELQQ